MKIDVIGSGSAYSASRNTSAVLVSDEAGNHWLIDCGPTIPRALWQRETEINQIDAIYFTHIHPDHCAGLPALINQWQSFHRHEPLDIYCQKAQKASLESLLLLATWPETSLCFEVRWHEITDHFTWKNWQLTTATTRHAVTNRALRVEADGQSLFYSGDGRPTAESQKLMEDVDLAFQECASASALADDASHGDFFSCRQLVSEINIGALGLYHCFDEEIDQLSTLVSETDGLFMSYDDLSVNLADQSAIRKLAQSVEG